jgi:hypothetical protein
MPFDRVTSNVRHPAGLLASTPGPYRRRRRPETPACTPVLQMAMYRRFDCLQTENLSLSKLFWIFSHIPKSLLLGFALGREEKAFASPIGPRRSQRRLRRIMEDGRRSGGVSSNRNSQLEVAHKRCINPTTTALFSRVPQSCQHSLEPMKRRSPIVQQTLASRSQISACSVFRNGVSVTSRMQICSPARCS